MRLSTALSVYIGRQFTLWFASVFLAFLGIILLFDFVELMRRASSKPDATPSVVMDMALLKLPQMAQEALPFVILLCSMVTFWRLTRSNELVVVLGAGVSVWQFLRPALVIALLVGVFKLAGVNPGAPVVQARSLPRWIKYQRGRPRSLAVVV